MRQSNEAKRRCFSCYVLVVFFGSVSCVSALGLAVFGRLSSLGFLFRLPLPSGCCPCSCGCSALWFRFRCCFRSGCCAPCASFASLALASVVASVVAGLACLCLPFLLSARVPSASASFLRLLGGSRVRLSLSGCWCRGSPRHLHHPQQRR